MSAPRTDYSEFEKKQLEDWLELCHEFLDGQKTPRDDGRGATLSVYGRFVKYSTSVGNELAALREQLEKAEAEVGFFRKCFPRAAGHYERISTKLDTAFKGFEAALKGDS